MGRVDVGGRPVRAGHGRAPRVPAAAAALAVLCVAAGGAAPGTAAAQEPGDARVRPGDRIQVRAPSLLHRRAEGELLSAAGDTLRIAGEDGGVGVQVHIGGVERLRVQRGVGDARWRGAFLGAAAGVITGVAVDEETRDDSDAVRNELRLGGLVGGAVLGWLVGRAFEVRRWVEVSPGAVGPAGAGVGLRLGVP